MTTPAGFPEIKETIVTGPGTIKPAHKVAASGDELHVDPAPRVPQHDVATGYALSAKSYDV